MTALPLMMTGFDRRYLPPRSIRRSVTGEYTAWELFGLERDDVAGDWATGTLDSLVASVTADAEGALGCIECEDIGFYGVADPDDGDLLTGLVRRVGDDDYQALATCGSWDNWDPLGVPLEVLDIDLAGDLAAAITGGACGLLRRYAWPRAFLPPTAVVAAASLKEVLSAGLADNPQSEWVNYAVVDGVDQGAVLDVVRIRAAGDADDMERWEAGAWTPAADLLTEADLPLVDLSADGLLEDVQAQMEPVVAYVSPDPRAERLRRFWTTGKGGAKIRWTAPGSGDFNRCVRYLRKYLGLRAKSYCATLHKRATGVWPGDRRNLGTRGSLGSVAGGASPSPCLIAGNTEPRPVGAVEHIFRVGEVVQLVLAESRTPVPPALIGATTDRFEVVGIDVPTVQTQHTTWTTGIQVVKNVVELVPVRDGPSMDQPGSPVSGSGTEPSPGRLSVAIGEEGAVPDPPVVGHDGVVRLEVTESRGWAAEPGGSQSHAVVPAAHPASETPDGGAGLVVSATGHKVYCTHSTCEKGQRLLNAPEMAIRTGFRAGRWTRRESEGNAIMASAELLDGIYGEVEDENEGLFRTLTAGGFPVAPPDEWYADPKLDGPTPLTVDDSGRVYGHIATFDVAHIGMAGRVHAPRSTSGYAYFLTGSLKTASGAMVNVGQLTLSGGHASLHADAKAAVKHYDDTNSGVADVAAGDDQYGVWVAGSLRPDITPEQVRTFRASGVSGDWRPLNGHLELVAVCSVPVPGFPVTRARVAGGAVVALVAAGARPLAERKAAMVADAALLDRVQVLETRLDSLHEVPTDAVPKEEDAQVKQTEPVAASVDVAEAPVVVDDPAEPAPLTAEETAAAGMISQARAEVAEIKREMLRKQVHPEAATTAAIPPQFLKNMKGKDGKAVTVKGTDSFPISDVASLKKAIQAFGRAKDKDAAKKHITSMAFKLKRPDLIPANWKG